MALNFSSILKSVGNAALGAVVPGYNAVKGSYDIYKAAQPKPPSGGMQFPIGAGMTPQQTNNAYATINRNGAAFTGPVQTAKAGFDAYKYDDDPTVYRSGDNYAFKSWNEFLGAGGNQGSIRTIARPKNIELSGGNYSVDPYTGGASYNEMGAGLNLDPVDYFTLDDLRSGSNTKTSASAITQFLEELRTSRDKYRTELSNAYMPSKEMQETQKMLSNLRANADYLRIATTQGALDLEKNPQPLAALRGKQANVYAEGELKTQTLAVQERTLLERLGIEQEAQQGKIKQAELGLSFLQQDSDTFFKAQEAMAAEEERLFNYANTLTDNARETLSFLVDSFVGLDITELPREVQQQIAQVASQAGLPIEAIAAGMKVAKDQQMFENLIDASSASGSGSDDLNTLLTPTEAQALGVPYGTTRGAASQMGITPQKELSAEARKLNSNVESGLVAIDAMRNLLSSNGTVKVFTPNPLSQTRKQYFTAADNLVDIIGRMRSGGAITVDEEKRFKSLLPKMTDSQDTWAGKLTQIESLLSNTLQDSDLSNDWNGMNQVKGMTQRAEPLPYLKTLGPITGLNGSPLWKHGLDIDLKKGDPVYSPVAGKVTFVGPNKGFGNQVKVQGADGREWWLSHLDAAGVKKGETIKAGQLIGLGGNSGNTIPGKGGDGSHLDMTVLQNGKYLSAPQVKSLLDRIFV